MKALAAAAVAGALLLGTPSSAWARAGPPLKLTLLGCKKLNQGEVGRILEAELGARLSAGNLPETTEVQVDCLGDSVLLRVRDPITRKGLSRLISLETEQPEAHARLVALAATELVLASWSELEFNPNPRVKSEGPVVPPELSALALQTVHERRVARGLTGRQPAVRFRRRVEPPASELRLAALASLREFFDNSGVLFGGGFRLGEDLTNLVSWSVDGMTEAGALDSVNSQTTTVGAAVLFFQRWRALTGRVGGGLRLALNAREADGTTGRESSYVIAPMGWPMLMSSLTVRLGTKALLELSVEGSYSLPISGPDNEQRTMSGAWCAMNLGLGVYL
ncbi:MAG: hypothetical protein JW940_17450 [Polyangiaceae bacterium]|nr:hypothetical protein [Polyangiaceae bacterium]